MKKHWGLCLLASILAGIILGVTMSYPAPSPILRGYQITIAEKLGLDTDASHSNSESVSKTEAQSELLPLDDLDDHQTPTKLDLSLPEIDWGDATWNAKQESFPNFFKPTPEEESRMNVSGKLHWDESEEAQTRPLKDTIMGAEVEFQVLLP